MASVVVLGIFVADLAFMAPRLPVMGETILGKGFKSGPGGKGSNQTIAAARAGGDVAIVTRIGRDTFGDHTKLYLAELLDFRPDQGVIRLHDQRVVILSAAAMGLLRKELIEVEIAEHEGRLVKLTGDGMLVEFPSVVNAVACAAEIQRRVQERNREVPAEQQIEFRIGVNVGDVIVEANRKAVTNVDELRSAVRSTSDRPLLLLVNREGRDLFMAVRPS